MSNDSRWTVPSTGALVSVAYDGSFRSVEKAQGVAESVTRSGDDVVVSLPVPVSGAEARFDPDSEEFGELSWGNETRELYQVKEVVPASQVKHPGVSAGDTVKIRTADTAYYVEDVEDGMVSLEDGREVPVTQVTAFDEDVDDYDPFEIIPGGVADIFGGGDGV